ncbi:MAG: sugar transferase [Bacteroidales bacterium]|jgi:exopolysaccharide biosynthesis polyprenyl glycosylphosphotransferase|nr:sugar transferase [Bacteroidales bacterium]
MNVTRETIINVQNKIIEVIVAYAVLFAVYYWLLPNYAFDNRDFVIFALFLAPVNFLISLLFVDLYISHTRSVSQIISSHFFASAVGFGVLLFVVKLCSLDIFGISFVAIFYAILFVVHCFVKYAMLQYYSNRKSDVRNIIIVGTGSENVSEIIEAVEKNVLWGYRIVAIFSDSQKIHDKYANTYTMYDISYDVSQYIVENNVHEVIYATNTMHLQYLTPLIYACLEVGVTFKLSSQFLNLAHSKGEVQYIGNTQVFSFQNTPRNYLALRVKTVLDVVISLLIMIVFSPVFIAVAIAVKVSSPGPIFFKQTRAGLRGKEFQLYKFRSMVHNAEELLEELQEYNEQDGPAFKIANDPRKTKVGNFLRKTSLDELPQFFNVLKGDMSIVGPRPPIPAEVAKYERWQLRRLSMKPGITCIWQVSSRNESTFEEWIKLDLQYIDTWSLRLDVMLFLQTIKVAFFKPTGR